MRALPLVLFALTYLAIAPGRLPGLALDRTGFALLGALSFLATGVISLDEAKAAVDAPTLALLFGMMVLSAQYQLSGLYSRIGDRLARSRSPRRLLLGTIVVAAALSAVLTNDVVCYALTPLLLGALLRAGLPALPYLFALAGATNIGSALTPIGNPQNILIAQRLDLRFLPFVAACAAPVLAALTFLYFLLARRLPVAAPADLPAPSAGAVPYDRWQARKALAVTIAALVLFLTPLPAALTALALAGVLLTSRRLHTRTILGLVDWHLLALFCGLFVVNRGLEVSGWTAAANQALAGAGVDLAAPAVLLPTVALLGILVGNVPAVMMLLPLLPREAEIGYMVALVSTFAGNAVLFGSIANLIVADQAARLGLRIGLLDHLKFGLPVTIVSLAAAGAAVVLLW